MCGLPGDDVDNSLRLSAVERVGKMPRQFHRFVLRAPSLKVVERSKAYSPIGKLLRIGELRRSTKPTVATVAMKRDREGLWID